MDRNTKWQNGKSFNRASDIEVSSVFKDRVETIALAHLAAGNTNEYMLAMNSLSKTQAKAELEELKKVVQGLVEANDTE